MSVRTQELLIGFGKGKQTDIPTANLVANIWQLKKLNASLANPKLQDAGDATSGAIRGRMEFGNREFNLKFVARFKNGSDELTKLKAQTTGTAVITLTYDANNSLHVTFQKAAFAVVEVGDTDGRVTGSVECTPLYDATSGVISAVAKCGIDGICQ